MATEFKLLSEEGDTVNKVFTIASQAYQVGDLVMLSPSAGTVIPATSSSVPSRLVGVAVESRTVADTLLLVTLIKPGQLWTADATNATQASDNLQRMLLTNAGTVNNTHTDSVAATAIFRQEGIVSATRIVGRFIPQASV